MNIITGGKVNPLIGSAGVSAVPGIAFNADTGSKEDIDAIFAKAEELFDKIDIFIANAGFPYYEKFDYVNYDKIDKIRGMDIIFVTTANTDEEAKELLTLLGAPFAKE